MLGTVEIDLPDGKTVSRFTDSGPAGRTMFLAVDTTASSTQALASLDAELRAHEYQPGPVMDRVTTYGGRNGTVSVHVSGTRGHTLTVVVAQHAPAASPS